MEEVEIKSNWHAFSEADVVRFLVSDADKGLSALESQQRIAKFGENKLPSKKKQPAFFRFLKHFNDMLIYILFAAAIISALLGHYADSLVIVLVAVINAFIGFFQEGKAERALENIKNMLPLKANVIREGHREVVDAVSLTLGDIVLLKPGSKVPADLIILEANNLKADESALTGESVSSDKSPGILEEDTMLGDRRNMAFSGTSISTGTAKGIVVAVGEGTELGKINKMIADVEHVTTPLLRQTAHFGKVISIFIVVFSAAVYAFGYFFRDYPPGELLMAVIGLAVAAIPEGLPAILSIIMAIGVQRMARRNAIVRQLPFVETLGSVSVICTDKTGTLTKNEMTVQALVTSDNFFTVTGTGYIPQGEVLNSDGSPVDFENQYVVKKLINGFRFCNEAELGKDDKGNWMIKGEPTEGALVTLYEKAKIPQKEITRLAVIPFDSTYKYMAVLLDTGYRRIIYIKGAPERIMDMICGERGNEGLKPFARDYWDAKIRELAHSGQRVIAAACKIVGDDKTTLTHEDIRNDVVFLGLAGIIDPPREEAIEAIKACAAAGIRVKMITGDHVETAKTIGFQMGIGDGERALQGSDLETMTDTQLQYVVLDNDIFARTSPEHKLRLVSALQAQGITCAMTGDGVNDAPALRKADIGIAMGIKGTEVSKEAAEVVLADDNFSTIAAAVEEGRRIYDNLKKTILFILPTNGAQSFLVVAAILLGISMPLTPVQILWVNMVTSITISFALAFEPIEPDAMKLPPRQPKLNMLNGYFIWRILFVSLLMGGGTLMASTYLLSTGVDALTVSTVTFHSIALAQMFHLFNCRSLSQFAFNDRFFSNPVAFIVSAILIVIQLTVTYVPFLSRTLGITPIGLYYWMYPVCIGISVFIIVEIEKIIMRKLGLSRLH